VLGVRSAAMVVRSAAMEGGGASVGRKEEGRKWRLSIGSFATRLSIGSFATRLSIGSFATRIGSFATRRGRMSPQATSEDAAPFSSHTRRSVNDNREFVCIRKFLKWFKEILG
jgi:hypothetical protein